MISQNEAKRLISYDPTTGSFVWRTLSPEMFSNGRRSAEQRCRIFNARYAGRRAFTAINGNGYLSGVISGHRLTAHRLAWIYMTGEAPDQIDHINGNRADNRFDNLRNVSGAENGRNCAKSARNTSGMVGIRWSASRQRWCADIRHNFKLHFLGRHKCLGRAIKARREAEERFGFHPNHGREA